MGSYCILFSFTNNAIAYSELYDLWERRHRYDSHKEISVMLDFHFPSYDVVGYEEIKVNNHLRQGYDITKTVRFKKPFNFSIYEFIDSLCYEPETRWETEQYELSYEKLVKEYVDKWGEDSLYLYVNKWDSIAKDKSKKVPNKYFYVGHLFQLQFNKKSGLVLIKYFDYQ